MVVVLLILWLSSTVPHILPTISLPCSLAVQPACLFTCPPICWQVLSCTQKERGHLLENCFPFNIPVVFYLQCFCVQSVMNDREDNSGREIAPNTGANATRFFTLATKSWKVVAKLATTTFHHNLTKRYSELNKFAKINPRQTSSLSLFPKRSTCISIDN